MLSQATKVQTAISRLTPVVAGHFCEAHERFGLDSEVVMLLQVSEGMRSPVRYHSQQVSRSSIFS